MTVTKTALVLDGGDAVFRFFSVKKGTDFSNLSPYNPGLSATSSNMKVLPHRQQKNPFLRAL